VCCSVEVVCGIIYLIYIRYIEMDIVSFSTLLACVALIALAYYYRAHHSGMSVSVPWGQSSLPVLSRYSRDLSRLAVDHKLDPVIGRESEIALVIQILSRRNKTIQCLSVRLE
jgi:hypothetical protein